MSLLLSMILTVIEDLSVANKLKLETACTKLQTLVDKAIKQIRFGKNLAKILLKISTEVQAQLAHIGSCFQEQNELVNLVNLRLWCDWALLHWTVLLVSYFYCPDVSMLKTLELVNFQYKEDFQLLTQLLMRNGSCFSIGFKFREENFFSDERWWVEVKLSILETNFVQENVLWESSEHAISQICLTKGHPKAQDYYKGLVKDPEFLEAWSCQNSCFEFRYFCVKCHFVQKICSDFKEKFEQILEEPISNVMNGLKNFKLLQ